MSDFFNKVIQGFKDLNPLQLLQGQIVMNMTVLIGLVGATITFVVLHSAWYWILTLSGSVGVQLLTIVSQVKQYRSACAAQDLFKSQADNIKSVIDQLEREQGGKQNERETSDRIPEEERKTNN